MAGRLTSPHRGWTTATGTSAGSGCQPGAASGIRKHSQTSGSRSPTGSIRAVLATVLRQHRRLGRNWSHRWKHYSAGSHWYSGAEGAALGAGDWVKASRIFTEVGIPQVLSYMLATPQRNLPLYGLVTNGTDFVFLKLLFQEVPYYARSRQFVLGQDHDLDWVLQILKRLAELVGQESWWMFPIQHQILMKPICDYDSIAPTYNSLIIERLLAAENYPGWRGREYYYLSHHP